MTIMHETIYGESVADLAPALAAIVSSMRPTGDGMWQMSAELPVTSARPFMRALMRCEAELLEADADALGLPGTEQRTAEQRRADALVRIVAELGMLLDGDSPN